MKIGIVGYGSIGQRHAANAVKLGHETIIYDPMGPCDVKFERDVYDRADAVVIATPSQYHESGLRACVERGKHVLIEKPISVAIGHLPQLLDLAAKKNLIVMMGNNLRFHPCVQEAKSWLYQGYIGKPAWARFTCASLSAKHPYLADGVILNTGAHEVDLALHLLGPAVVMTACVRQGEYGDDMVDFVLAHENGCRSSFHLDFVTSPEVRRFRIAGDDGYMHCDLPQRFLFRTQPDDKLTGVNHAKPFKGEGSYDDDYLAEMRAFIAAIEGTPMQGATGAAGLATLRLLLDVRRIAGL